MYTSETTRKSVTPFFQPEADLYPITSGFSSDRRSRVRYRHLTLHGDADTPSLELGGISSPYRKEQGEAPWLFGCDTGTDRSAARKHSTPSARQSCAPQSLPWARLAPSSSWWTPRECACRATPKWQGRSIDLAGRCLLWTNPLRLKLLRRYEVRRGDGDGVRSVAHRLVWSARQPARRLDQGNVTDQAGGGA